MLQFSQFVWILRSSALVVFNNFLLIDATDRSKICSDQKRFFIALSLYPLSFFANTPFKRLNLNLNRRISSWLVQVKSYIKLFSKERNNFTVSKNYECKETDSINAVQPSLNSNPYVDNAVISLINIISLRFDGNYQATLKSVRLPLVSNMQCENLLRKTRLTEYFILHE